MKLKRFCIAKRTNIWTKWQPMEWEMISINSTFNGGLISKIQKELRKYVLKNKECSKEEGKGSQGAWKEEILQKMRRMQKPIKTTQSSVANTLKTSTQKPGLCAQ